MALPTSRNTTYGASSPILSADLNALQDQIVGVKHPATPRVLGASSFLVKQGTATLGAGQWTFGAVTDLVKSLADLVVVGDRLTTVQFCYNRGGAGAIVLSLKQRNIVTGAAEALVVAATTINAGTGWTTTTITYNYTIPANTAVHLEINANNVANIFGGAVINNDRL